MQMKIKLAQLTHHSFFFFFLPLFPPFEQSIGEDVYAFNFAPGGEIHFTTSAPRVDIGLTYEGNFDEAGQRVPCSGDPFSRPEGGCGVIIIEVDNRREYTFNGDDILGTLTCRCLSSSANFKLTHISPHTVYYEQMMFGFDSLPRAARCATIQSSCPTRHRSAFSAHSYMGRQAYSSCRAPAL